MLDRTMAQVRDAPKSPHRQEAQSNRPVLSCKKSKYI
jgi:hypothetical protein